MQFFDEGRQQEIKKNKPCHQDLKQNVQVLLHTINLIDYFGLAFIPLEAMENLPGISDNIPVFHMKKWKY